MGYSKRGGVNYFWPDNDKNTLWIDIESSIFDLKDIEAWIRNHFGEDANLDDFNFETENLRTACIYYDLYDSSDYTLFLKITRK